MEVEARFALIAGSWIRTLQASVYSTVCTNVTSLNYLFGLALPSRQGKHGNEEASEHQDEGNGCPRDYLLGVHVSSLFFRVADNDVNGFFLLLLELVQFKPKH